MNQRKNHMGNGIQKVKHCEKTNNYFMKNMFIIRT